jgi:hypothetical protein
MPVTHAYNLSHWGGRYQEDHNSKPARGNSLRDPILKKNNTKKDWWVAQVVGVQPSKYEALNSNLSTIRK